MNVIFTVGVAVLVGLIVFGLITFIVRTLANLRSPIEAIRARVVAKRTLVSGGANNTSASTTYYVTFEYEDGQREEFQVGDTEYGLTAEGDRGTVRRQGTWYKGFERTKPARR